MKLTRRRVLEFAPAAALLSWAGMAKAETLSSILFLKTPDHAVWDSWAVYHNGLFYAFDMTASSAMGDNKYDGWELWTSKDGVRWQSHGQISGLMSDGEIWPAIASHQNAPTFVTQVFSHETINQPSERLKSAKFSVSKDLFHWEPLGSEFDLPRDDINYTRRWAGPNTIVARPGGGYYGYITADTHGNLPVMAMSESDDGLHWRSVGPVHLKGLEVSDNGSPEVSQVYAHGGRYYAITGPHNFGPTSKVEQTTFVSQKAEGPFYPATKNRRILVGDAAYFMRFFDTPEGVLVIHHIYARKTMNNWLPTKTSYVAPLKLAEWDGDGTLRLKWRPANDKAKSKRLPLGNDISKFAFDPSRVTILEGVVEVSDRPLGLYIDGNGQRGTGFLIYPSGRTEYGDVNADGTAFALYSDADRDLKVEKSMSFRLVRKGRVAEFYVNDYLMQCYSLPELGSGRIGLIGRRGRFTALKAWDCA